VKDSYTVVEREKIVHFGRFCNIEEIFLGSSRNSEGML